MGVEGELVRKARFPKKSGNTFLMVKIFVSKDSHQGDSFFFCPIFVAFLVMHLIEKHDLSHKNASEKVMKVLFSSHLLC